MVGRQPDLTGVSPQRCVRLRAAVTKADAVFTQKSVPGLGGNLMTLKSAQEGALVKLHVSFHPLCPLHPKPTF